MEGELFAVLYRLIEEESRRLGRSRRVQFGDGLILRVMLWAALHDRPVCWACQSRHWDPAWCPLQLPSNATMSRRMRRVRFWLLLAAVIGRLQQVIDPDRPAVLGEHPLTRRIDTKPLIVGGFSKDKDARWGYATGGKARGYKLLLLWGHSVMPEQVALASLKTSDGALLGQMLPQVQGQGYLLGDALFDENDLHGRAAAQDLRLLCPRKRPGTGRGHCRHEPSRLRNIDQLEGPFACFGPSLYRLREPIERDLGSWCSFAAGLAPLPAWVRHPRKVMIWIACKLLINAARLCRNKRLAA